MVRIHQFGGVPAEVWNGPESGCDAICKSGRSNFAARLFGSVGRGERQPGRFVHEQFPGTFADKIRVGEDVARGFSRAEAEWEIRRDGTEHQTCSRRLLGLFRSPFATH